MNVDKIIIENERRKSRNETPFDPLSGRNSVGPRFSFIRKGCELWLPESMRKIIGLEHMSDDDFDRERVRHDFPYWAAKYAYIKSKGGGEDRLFMLNRPQRILVERLEATRNAGKPIRLILLKARQWGGSTCTQLYMAWLQLLHEKGLNSLIIAHQRAATDEIKNMFDRLIFNYPSRLLTDDGSAKIRGGAGKGEGIGGKRKGKRLSPSETVAQ